MSSQLKGLPEKLASRVARHLAAAGLLIDEDPETAYRHTLAARARAPRLAVVREAAGEAAYASGHYAEALADLRAAKRMNGATAYLPMMADCHRALGQPEQAVKLAKSPSVAGFPAAAKAEMTIVEAGARRDMGQLDAALRTLELAPLTSKSREPWVVRLRYAYADTLEAAGREADALAWFHRTDAIDGDQLTDAADRAEAIEKRINDYAGRPTGSSRRRGSRRTAWPTAAGRGRRPGSARWRPTPGWSPGHLEHDLVAGGHGGALGVDELGAEQLRVAGHADASRRRHRWGVIVTGTLETAKTLMPLISSVRSKSASAWKTPR